MKVLIAGDYCPIERVGDLVERGEFAAVFSDARTVVQQADYSIVNLECPVRNANARPIVKHGPNLYCNRNGVEAIKWTGFNCVTLANNHFLDYGAEGVKETLTTLDQLGIDHVGGGMNLGEASTLLYKKVGHEVLAVINCCEHEFSIATDTTAGSNPLNPVRQFAAIREAREHADYVLVIVHGGHEHFQLPSPRMQETYRFFIDAGADAVVNHHQHCFSGYEVYNGKPIFYGLGNFCFDDVHNRDGIWTQGYCVELSFSDSDPVFTLHKYVQCSKDPTIKMISPASFNESINKLNEVILTPSSLLSIVEKYYESSSKYYSSIFEPLYNKLFLKARLHGWLPSLISKKRKLTASNYVQCEAQRDKLIWYLNH